MDNNGINEAEKSGFKKEIGLFGGISIIGGIIIGSGIFYIGSYVLQRTHMSFGLALICWLVGGVITLLGSLCFAELGAEFPVAGGEVVYLNEAYHPIAGFSYGFTALLISSTTSLSALSIAIPTAFRSFFPISDLQIKLIAFCVIIGLTVYNCFGVKWGSILGNIAMVAKLIPLVVIIIAALACGKQSPNLSLIPQGGSGSTSFSDIIGMIAFGTISSLWAYDGWENLGAVAEEMKNPKKDLPKALVISAVGVFILYALFNFSIWKVLPLSVINSTINSGDLYLGTKVAKIVLGSAGGIIVLACMLVSMLSCLNAEVIAFPRNYYAMAQGGHFFKSFGRLNPKTKVPMTAMIVQCVIAIILISLRNLEQLTSLCMFCTMIYNVMCVAAVIVCRKRFPKKERPFKAWGYPVVVILDIVIYIGLLYNSFFTDPQTAITGCVVPIISFFVYFIFDRKNKKDLKNRAGQNSIKQAQ